MLPITNGVRHPQRAFTLLELIIVVAIIAILAAILIPNFLHARSESITAACESNEKRLAIAEEEYAVDHGGSYVLLASLTTPYLRTTRTDPVNKSSRYRIIIPGGLSGSYLLTDAGGHDPSTMRRLRKTTGAVCINCTSVLYAQNSGIHGN